MPFNSANNCYSNSNYSGSVNQNLPPDANALLPYPTFYDTSGPKRPQQYVQSGQVHSSVSNYNSDELRRLNNEEDMSGGGNIGKFFKKVGRTLNKPLVKQLPSVKQINKVANTVGKSITDKNGLGRHLIQATNNVVLPALGTAIGAAVGTAVGQPVVGAMVGNMAAKIGRQTLEKQTGYGEVPQLKRAVRKAVKKAVSEAKGNIPLTKLLDKYIPDAVNDTKKAVGAGVKPSKAKKSMKDRNVIVAQVMKEHGLSLPQASSYVKKNGLY
jgi:hypothetical protein